MRATGTCTYVGVVAILALLTGQAAAVDRDCPAGQSWSPNLGACVNKTIIRERSPEESYYAAIDLVEGKRGAPNPARAAVMLAGSCDARHGASCTLLGFLHERGRLGPASPRAALARYDAACEFGDAEGCVSAANVHAKGLLGDPDPAAAITPLTRACELGAGRGCVDLAEKYQQALGVAKDEAKARALYTRAFERLSAECPKRGPSCYQLGLLHTYGNGVEVDYPRAREVFVAGCDAGSGASCYAVGYLIQRGFGSVGDEASALPYHLRSCEQYDSPDGCRDAGAILARRSTIDSAQLNALATRACKLSTAYCDLEAHLLTTGKGGVTDEARATETYVRACKAGNAVACSAAASRIAHGEGVTADGELATQIWERACETGSGQDCWQAGVSHRDGVLVKADAVRAFERFATGCVRKSAVACEDAAEMALIGDHGAKPDPARAIELFEAGCELGRGETCARLGDIYRDGEGISADPSRAVAAYTVGCKRDDSSCCANLARLHETGPLRDLPAAFGERARACQLGDGTSCRQLETLAGPSEANDAIRARATTLLTSSCDADPHVEDACTTLAHSYAFGGIAGRVPKRAKEIAHASCERGFQPACLLAADYQLLGIGGVANAASARERYTRLCDQELPEACWKLGNLLVQDQKHEDAVQLFQRACDDDLPPACNSLGFALYTGRGIEWNVAEALTVYQRACTLGDEYGCANVGEMHQFGIGVPVDLAAAATSYATTCDETTVAGCAHLGELTERGLGRKADPAKARELYLRACDAGAAEACRWLAALDEASPKPSRPAIARLYQRAYDLAHAQAASNPYYAYVVGTFYQSGVGVAADARTAATWFDTACEGRDPVGCLAAGDVFARGAGVPRSLRRAAAMFDRACAAGVERACARAVQAKARLPMSGLRCGCTGGTGDPGVALLAVMVGAGLLRKRGGGRKRRS